MNFTQRHVAFAVLWLFGLPLVFMPFILTGSVPNGELQSAIWSAAWGLGLVGTFASWALRDAPAHGKSIYVVVLFVAAWFLVFFLAVVPYLFTTRGARAGTVASLRYLGLCAGCVGGAVAIALFLRAAR